jgi:hypothetical protein
MMKKVYVLLSALACSVALTAGSSQAADLTGPKIVHEPEQKKVKFVDEKGKVLKEISLAREKTKVKIKDDRKKREWDGERVAMNVPVISPTGKFVVLDTSLIDTPAPTSEYLQVYEYAGEIVTGGITLYNITGDVLFEKTYPRGTGVTGARPELTVSDTGIVAVITGAQDVPEGENILHAYNSNGLEILTYPKKEGEHVYPLEIQKISPNGKYLAVKTGFFPEASDTTVFFDLEKNVSWRADRKYIVKEITDDGIVRATYRDPSEKKTMKTEVNLKDMMGGEQK